MFAIGSTEMKARSMRDSPRSGAGISAQRSAREALYWPISARNSDVTRRGVVRYPLH
ncbi:hypothetical protein J6590_013269 [Homalodisca vitripennis]|nr:hypothetical protein J6590_013269 [Homalodisca vitripennis]